MGSMYPLYRGDGAIRNIPEQGWAGEKISTLSSALCVEIFNENMVIFIKKDFKTGRGLYMGPGRVSCYQIWVTGAFLKKSVAHSGSCG
ncbi:MAG: hypothetical protein C0613_02480 [Desulfobulbaceae bacterium]|nr:MAG: hypothetical protein C0613_02480 [Desulfobulbaceae bacterium]